MSRVKKYSLLVLLVGGLPILVATIILEFRRGGIEDVEYSFQNGAQEMQTMTVAERTTLREMEEWEQKNDRQSQNETLHLRVISWGPKNVGNYYTLRVKRSLLGAEDYIVRTLQLERGTGGLQLISSRSGVMPAAKFQDIVERLETEHLNVDGFFSQPYGDREYTIDVETEMVLLQCRRWEKSIDSRLLRGRPNHQNLLLPQLMEELDRVSQL